MRGFLLSVLMIVLAAAPARAADIDVSGAAKLKGEIAQSIGWYTSMSAATGQGLAIGGEVEVTPKKSYYEVKIPAVSALTGSGYSLDVGTVVLNVAPGEDDGWLVSAALPTPMYVRDATGEAIASVTIGKQRLSTFWRPDVDAIVKTDAAYEGIAVKPLKQGALTAAIVKMTLLQDLKENADGTWSGPNTMQVDHLSVVYNQKAAITLEINKILETGSNDHLPLKEMMEAKIKVLTYLREKKGQYDEQQQRQIVSQVASKFVGFPNGFDARNEIDGLTVDVEPRQNAPGQQPLHIELGKFDMTTTATGLKQTKGGGSVTTHMSGLKTTGLSEPYGSFIPESLNIDARLDDLPMLEVTKDFTMLMNANAAQKGTEPQRIRANADIQSVFSSLPQVLAGNGAALTVKNTNLHAQAMDVAVDGNILANAASPIFAIGNMKITVGGFDEMIEKYRKIVHGGPGTNAYAEAMVPFEMMGKLEKDAAGRSTRTYAFELTPDGKIMMNGLDMSAVKALMNWSPGGSSGAASSAPITTLGPNLGTPAK